MAKSPRLPAILSRIVAAVVERAGVSDTKGVIELLMYAISTPEGAELAELDAWSDPLLAWLAAKGGAELRRSGLVRAHALPQCSWMAQGIVLSGLRASARSRRGSLGRAGDG